MRPLTEPRHYYDNNVYQEEKEKIFYTTWQFAGIMAQLRHHNDFITFTVCDKDVVVQNFQGELRAFANVCSHRYARIQTEVCGNRMLKCPYHSWVYNSDGVPIGIPCKENFDPFNNKDYALDRYEVEVCGEIVFVKITPGGQRLREYVGDIYDRIAAIASSLDEPTDILSVEVNANWKTLVENSLEGYHVDSVHPNTIRSYFVGKDSKAKASSLKTYNQLQPELSPNTHVFQMCAPHSYVLASVGKDALENWTKVSSKLKFAGFQEKIYSQHNIFPNFNIATFYGGAFFLQVFRPITPTKSLVLHYSVSAKLSDESKKLDFIYKTVLRRMIDAGKEILMEDVEICETVQKGLSNASKLGILCHEEDRVRLHQESYRNLIF